MLIKQDHRFSTAELIHNLNLRNGSEMLIEQDRQFATAEIVGRHHRRIPILSFQFRSRLWFSVFNDVQDIVFSGRRRRRHQDQVSWE